MSQNAEANNFCRDIFYCPGVIGLACFLLSLALLALAVLSIVFDLLSIEISVLVVGCIFGLLVVCSFWLQREDIRNKGDWFIINLFLTFCAAVYFFALAYQYYLVEDEDDSSIILDIISHGLLGFGVIACGITLMGDINLIQIWKTDDEENKCANLLSIMSGIILIVILLIYSIVYPVVQPRNYLKIFDGIGKGWSEFSKEILLEVCRPSLLILGFRAIESYVNKLYELNTGQELRKNISLRGNINRKTTNHQLLRFEHLATLDYAFTVPFFVLWAVFQLIMKFYQTESAWGEFNAISHDISAVLYIIFTLWMLKITIFMLKWRTESNYDCGFFLSKNVMFTISFGAAIMYSVCNIIYTHYQYIDNPEVHKYPTSQYFYHIVVIISMIFEYILVVFFLNGFLLPKSIIQDLPFYVQSFGKYIVALNLIDIINLLLLNNETLAHIIVIEEAKDGVYHPKWEVTLGRIFYSLFFLRIEFRLDIIQRILFKDTPNNVRKSIELVICEFFGKIFSCCCTVFNTIKPRRANRLLFAGLCVILMLLEVVWLVAYTVSGYTHHEFWYMDACNAAVGMVFLLISLFNQREKFMKKAKNIIDHPNIYQEFYTNFFLTFMVALYYGLLFVVALLNNEGRTAFSNIGIVVGAFVIGFHLTGDLEWGLIFDQNERGQEYRFTPNWWCKMYLIAKTFSLMFVSCTFPWRVYNDPVYGFKLQAEEIVETTGAVVQGLIQYICRPCITIVGYRSIEQIVHQLLHFVYWDRDSLIHNHDDDEHHHSNHHESHTADHEAGPTLGETHNNSINNNGIIHEHKVSTNDLDLSSADLQSNPMDDSMGSLWMGSKEFTKFKKEHLTPVAIKFTHLTTSGYIIIIPAFLGIAVSDLYSTFNNDSCDIGYALPIVSSYMIIGAIPIVQLLYQHNLKPFHVFEYFKEFQYSIENRQSRLGEICVKHFGLLVAFVGVIITDFAIMVRLWSDCSSKWFLQIPHLMTTITNTIVVLYLRLAFINKDSLPFIMNRFNKFYVKFLVVFWMYSVVFSFLKEAHHLHEVLEIEKIEVFEKRLNTTVSDINSHLYKGMLHSSSHSDDTNGNECFGLYLNGSCSVKTESSHHESCQVNGETPLYKCANTVEPTQQFSNYTWCDSEILVKRVYNNTLNCEYGHSYVDESFCEIIDDYVSCKLCNPTLPVCDLTILKRNWYQDDSGECDHDIYNDTLYVVDECIEDGEHNSFIFKCVEGNQFDYYYYTNSHECTNEEETESEINTIPKQIEFTLFFLNIEFLLALIERIRWKKKHEH